MQHKTMNALGHAILLGTAVSAWAQWPGAVAEEPQGDTETSAGPPAVTFYRDVAPIIQNRCQECHRQGGVAPFVLSTYEQVAGWAKMIREVVVQRRMPPWHADPRYGRFANDRRLSDAEIRTLIAWVDGGMPKGGGRAFRRGRPYSGGWGIGQPDVVFQMPEEATLPAAGVIPYHFYQTPTNFREDKWVSRAQTLPGNARVVHHILIYIRDGNNNQGERRVLGIGQGLLDGYAPGDDPLVLEPGVGIRIPRGATLEWQIHYTPTGKVEKDRSRIGLVFAHQPPQREMKTAPAVNYNFVLPPRAPNHRVDSQYTFAADAWLLALRPHMHYRGKSFEYDALYPNGRSEVLLYVPAYDFNWQTNYQFENPLPMPAGTRIRCRAYFDNSRGNPFNPNANAAVRYGLQSWDEMMIGWLSFVWDRP